MPVFFLRPTGCSLALIALLAACGGSSSTEAPAASPPVAMHTVGGTVSAMTAGLELQNNGADDLRLMANGSFGFASGLPEGATYNVTVRLNPPFQLCTVSNGAGTMGSADVTNVSVSCVNGVQVSTFAGGNLGSADGTGTAAMFHEPRAGVFDADGNLLVTDTYNNSLRKITPSGVVSTLATGLNGPFGVTISLGRIYVASEFGDKLFEVDAVTGTVTEVMLSIALTGPRGVVGDAAGNLYVSESTQLIRKITPSGVVTTFAGSGVQGQDDGQGTAASFYNPAALAIDASGNVFVADQNGPLIRRITPTGAVTTVGGRPWMGGGVDGPAATATLTEPVGIALGSDGMVYVAENGGHTVRRVSPDGAIETLAGQHWNPGAVDGPGATARLSWPAGLAFDAQGDLFVFDSGNNRVRKLTRN